MCIRDSDNIDTRRGSLFDEYTEARTAKFQMHSMEDYDRLKQVSACLLYTSLECRKAGACLDPEKN